MEGMEETCHEVESLLSGYALGALDPEGQRFVEMHLDACPSCKLLLDSYRSIVDGILHIVPPVQPPKRLRASLKARIASPVAENWRKRFRRSIQPQWVLAAAILALLFLNLTLLGQVRNLSRAHNALAVQVEEDQVALSLASYPSVQMAKVTGEGGYGTFLYEPNLEVAVLYVWHLSPLPPGQTYQVWLIEPDGDRVNGGVFTGAAEGDLVRLIIASPVPLRTFVGMGVTIEPKGGSPAPTGPRVVGAEL
ncbi:MAG: hypothetical protein GTO14_18790 [Anaerolineales bacterium]|nr:hypothetical protein [Anaerolineales bacterium]